MQVCRSLGYKLLLPLHAHVQIKHNETRRRIFVFHDRRLETVHCCESRCIVWESKLGYPGSQCLDYPTSSRLDQPYTSLCSRRQYGEVEWKGISKCAKSMLLLYCRFLGNLWGWGNSPGQSDKRNLFAATGARTLCEGSGLKVAGKPCENQPAVVGYIAAFRCYQLVIFFFPT